MSGLDSLDTATWQALGLVLTLLGLAASAVLWRRRGAGSGLRGVAWSLLPLAAALTGTLRLAGDVANDVARWASRLVFDPVTWTGIALAGVSVVLLAVSARLRGRAPQSARGSRRAAPAAPAPRGVGSQRSAPAADPELAEIEQLLRRRGIE